MGGFASCEGEIFLGDGNLDAWKVTSATLTVNEVLQSGGAAPPIVQVIGNAVCTDSGGTCEPDTGLHCAFPCLIAGGSLVCEEGVRTLPGDSTPGSVVVGTDNLIQQGDDDRQDVRFEFEARDLGTADCTSTPQSTQVKVAVASTSVPDCSDGDECTTDCCSMDTGVAECCGHTPIECPSIPCTRLLGCDPREGCQYEPDCAIGADCEDCNADGKPDSCAIQLGINEDCNGNGVPDDCETATLHMTMSPIPPDETIDARQDQSSTGIAQGFDRILVSFPCQPFEAASGRPLTSSSISIRTTGGDVPEVVGLTPDPQKPFTYELVLSKPIPAGEWTTFSVDASNQIGTAVGVGTTFRLGFLPGDVNGSETSAPGDILTLVDHLNQVLKTPLNEWQCDIDRSGVCAPADILRLIDLLNGRDTLRPWNGVSLPHSH